MDILSWKRDLGDLKRLQQIITILVEEGFHAHLTAAKLARHAKIHSRLKHARKKHSMTPDGVTKTLERLGPTFVKLGQVLSLRPDLVPEEYCTAFKKLQSSVTPIPFKTVQSIIENELGKPPNKIFKSIQSKPLAAASIAQVHRAVLHDGTNVVVKVQRPNIRKMMEKDIDIMSYIAKKIDHSQYKALRAGDVVEEFKKYTEKELDFKCELGMTKKFHNYFKDDKSIVIPTPHEELSTGKVLVLEFLDGILLTDKEALLKKGFNLTKLAHYGAQAILKQTFELRVFHADPHPGNLIGIMKGKRQQLGMIDFGIVGHLDPETETSMLELLNYLIDKDVQGCARVLLRLGDAGPKCDPKKLKERYNEIVMDWSPDDLGSDSLTSVIYRVLLASIDEDLRLPANIITTAKALVTIEGTAVWLNPHMSIEEEAKPLMTRYMSEQFGIKGFAKQVKKQVPELKEIVEELPQATEKFVKNLEEGKIEVHLTGEELRQTNKDYDLEMNKRNITIIACTLFIGSVVLAALNSPVEFLGQPLYGWGFAGFIVTLIVLHRTSRKIHKYNEENN